jgi:DNA modification methylase
VNSIDPKLTTIKETLVGELIPYASNSRTHSEEQVAQIAASIKEFGFTNPILTDGKNGIIAGHGRLEAARLLGINEVPTIELAYLTPAQRKAYIIADNKLALNAGWDIETLQAELEGLQELDFDLALTGFDESELAGLLDTNDGLTDPDAIPDNVEPTSVLGDVWTLGRHRIVCGDCTDADVVAKCLDGGKADLVFTSPPYNANAMTGDGDIFNNKKSVKMYAAGSADNMDSDEYVQFARTCLEICFSNTDGFIFWNVNYNAKSKSEYIEQITPRAEYLVEQICWRKSSTIPFKGSMMRDWEPVYVFSTNKQNLNLKSVVSNLWEINNTGTQTAEHKACFPVDLPKKAIGLVNKNTGIVYEPFSGSGTTIIAAEMTGRCCYAIELNPAYVDIAVKRWEDFTGEKAVRDASA